MCPPFYGCVLVVSVADVCVLVAVCVCVCVCVCVAVVSVLLVVVAFRSSFVPVFPSLSAVDEVVLVESVALAVLASCESVLACETELVLVDTCKELSFVGEDFWITLLAIVVVAPKAKPTETIAKGVNNGAIFLPNVLPSFPSSSVPRYFELFAKKTLNFLKEIPDHDGSKIVSLTWKIRMFSCTFKL